MFFSNESMAYFLEHFEFDSSENTKKRHKMRKERAKVKRMFIDGNGGSIKGPIEGSKILSF